eukprot:gene7319-13031_t
MCVDYRALNAKTVPFTFPIPRIDELLDKLHGGAVFSVLDLKNGYHHIPIKEEDRAKTAFVLPNAKYQWKRMPFGLVGAPYSFAATMTDIFKGTEDYVACYFDDILIFSNDIKSHFEHLTHVLNKLASAGMKINQRKCDFVKQEVEVLTQAERRYSVTDKELLAVFYAVKKLEVYLYGAAFMVYTDHKPLTYLNSFKDILNRRYRWIEYLQEMGVKIAYVPGKENIVADYLSRNIREEKPLDALGGYSMYLAKDLLTMMNLLQHSMMTKRCN